MGPASVLLHWGGESRSFRLGLDEIAALEEAISRGRPPEYPAGPAAVLARLRGDAWRLADVCEPIRLGLIGAGQEPGGALDLVRLHVEACPLVDSVEVAAEILAAAIGSRNAPTAAPPPVGIGAAAAAPPAPIDFGLDAFDRIAAAEEAGAAIRLTNPRGGSSEPLRASDGTPVSITVRGAGSAAYDAARADARRRLELVSHLQGTPAFAREADEAEIGALAAMTVGWQGIVVNGGSLAFSPEAAAGLYRRFTWIREQVGRAVADPRRFSPATL